MMAPRHVLYAVAWSAVAHLAWSSDPEHLRLLIIATAFALLGLGMSYRRRRDGEKSAYAMLNPGGEALDGDLDLRSFGLRNMARPSGAVHHRTVDSTYTSSTIKRFSDTLLEPCFDGDKDRFEQYLAQLAASSMRVKRHHPCPCRSGKKFAACCAELQVYLRETRYLKHTTGT